MTLRTAGKRTAAGGPSAHFGPIRDLLPRSDASDAVVGGEGEGAAVDLVRGLSGNALTGLSSVAWLDDGRVKVGPPAPIPDVEDLPSPVFDEDEVRDYVPLLASRGCTARCDVHFHDDMTVGGDVAVWLAPRHEARPCFARTSAFNVFHDGDRSPDRSGLDGLLRVVVRLVRRNEAARGSNA